ncbi:MAG: histidinol-phosphate transaminase [Chloroflexi bacterium]|nr:histidinol-phosphate transaminase [Chloroflexota bacterium]
MDILDLVRPEVRGVRPYTLRHHTCQIKLNQNENSFDFPSKLKEEVWRRVQNRPWSRYPDFFVAEITQALARYAGMPAEGVLVGNGSNELLQLTFMTMVGRDDRVLIPVPTFPLYKLLGTVLGAQVIEIPLAGEGFALPTDELMRMAEEYKPKMIVLCTPNNPTGSAYREEEIVRIIEGSRALVVLDEAYHEFAEQNLRHLLDRHGNVVILRTFSKAMSMAGLRVGYLLGNPALVVEMGKAKLPYSLNIFSQEAALVAIEHVHLLHERVKQICQLRNQLYDRLRAIDGVHPLPSSTNFILCRLAKPVKQVFADLAEAGILVRDVSAEPQLHDCLRISVGSQEENETLVAVLSEIMAKE